MGKPDQPRGPDGKWRKRSGVAVAAALAATVAYGQVGVTGGGTASVESSISQALRTKLDKGKRNAAKGRPGAAWKDLSLKRTGQRLFRGARCAVNSYGDVQRFLFRTPCRSLDRMLYALDDEQGNRIVVSVAWVDMRNAVSARELRALADVHGTGNIAPLPGSFVGVGDIRWTGRNYDSRRSNRLVVIAEVEPVSGAPSPGYLDGIADVAAEFPRP
ncbi:hypothetical protein [Prauserella flavalba]|uniref:hypothetical protein n=1 Tax=Prauserella flavalba TaxID=1477506 RepID=UPI0036E058A0